MKDEGGGAAAVAKAMPEDMSAARRRELTPRADMMDDALRDQQAELGAAMEIEVLSGSPLRIPSDFPSDIRQYGDPVNRRLPNDTRGRAQAAIGRARQTMDRYTEQRSRRIVWERVIRAALRHGLSHELDPEDPLDRSLPSDLQEQLRAAAKADKQKRGGVRKCLAAAMSAARTLAQRTAGHHADLVEKRAAAERDELKARLADERAKRVEAERKLDRVRKNSQRPRVPAPSSLSYGEHQTADRHTETFAWSHDLAAEANALDKRRGTQS